MRVVGKLLFPRTEILQWVDAARSGPAQPVRSTVPPTILGSHDPLLEWAIRESGSGLASFFDGSRDGLGRLLLQEGVASGTHLYEGSDWNVDTVRSMFGNQSVVLVEFAKRMRGLVLALDNPKSIVTLADASLHRVAFRHAGAASQHLFERLLVEAGIAPDALNLSGECARTEDELGMQVFDDRADVAFGLQSVASRLKLSFKPLLQERFDLLVCRHAWFEPPFQAFLEFTRSDLFYDKAESLGGYDLSSLGKVHFNGDY